jgi:uncharacterized protein YdcH (DUF465 family)
MEDPPMQQMHVSEDALKTKLRKEDPTFLELELKHRRLDNELMRFELHVYLSPQEERERRDMQKQKLAVKDRMAAILRSQALN